MKANGAKRKIFNDAVDLLAGAEEVSALEEGIRMLLIDDIRAFRKHPFRLYEGERLDDMVESIKEHGVPDEWEEVLKIIYRRDNCQSSSFLTGSIF